MSFENLNEQLYCLYKQIIRNSAIWRLFIGGKCVEMAAKKFLRAIIELTMIEKERENKITRTHTYIQNERIKWNRKLCAGAQNSNKCINKINPKLIEIP